MARRKRSGMYVILMVTIALQVVGALVLLWWWVERRAAGPIQAFEMLRKAVDEGGPAQGLELLEGRVVRGVIAACKRDACLQQRFGGEITRYKLSAISRGGDPCEDFTHPECTVAVARDRLRLILSRMQATPCRAERFVLLGAHQRVQVDCGGVTDYIDVEQTVAGWRIVASEEYPGFMPRLFGAELSQRANR